VPARPRPVGARRILRLDREDAEGYPGVFEPLDRAGTLRVYLLVETGIGVALTLKAARYAIGPRGRVTDLTLVLVGHEEFAQAPSE